MKVEKVVKPPQIPTFRNRTYRGLRLLDFNVSAVIIPMKKLPSKLIAKVFIGNKHCSLTGINPIRYRKTEPNAPPSATDKHSSIFLLLFLRVSEIVRGVKVVKEWSECTDARTERLAEAADWSVKKKA